MLQNPVSSGDFRVALLAIALGNSNYLVLRNKRLPLRPAHRPPDAPSLMLVTHDAQLPSASSEIPCSVRVRAANLLPHLNASCFPTAKAEEKSRALAQKIVGARHEIKSECMGFIPRTRALLT